MNKTTQIYQVLFLCTGNSARSVIAEALLNHRGGGRFSAYSAGSHPTGQVNPLALQILEEMQIPVQAAGSKSWDEFSGVQAPEMDLVVTVCDSAAAEACPVWPGAPLKAHWGLPDPAAVTGDQLHRQQAFRDAFRVLDYRIAQLLTVPLRSLDARRCQALLGQIGMSTP